MIGLQSTWRAPANVGKRSFEELIATVYRDKDNVMVSENRREIKKKVSVASAKSDKRHTIKKLTLNACKKRGLHSGSNIIALSDGAKNCCIRYVDRYKRRMSSTFPSSCLRFSSPDGSSTLSFGCP